MATFLLRNLRPDLRLALELDAVEQDLPIQELIRSILCEHYSYDCPSVQGYRRKDQWNGSTTILLKNVDPGLFSQIKTDAQAQGKSMVALIREILESRYVTTREVA